MGSHPKYPTWGLVTEGNSNSTAIALGLEIMGSSTRHQGQWEVSFGSPRGQQGSVVLFLCLKYQSPTVESHTAGSCGPSHCLFHLPYWTAHPPALCSSKLKEAPATASFLPFLGWAARSQLQGCVCGPSSELSSLLVSLFIPSCPLLDISIFRSLMYASVLSREFFAEL